MLSASKVPSGDGGVYRCGVTIDAWREALEVELAKCDRRDPAHREAARLVRAELARLPCVCLSLDAHYTVFTRRGLGCDQRGADLAVETCRTCGRAWIWYLEEDHHENSGRTFHCPVDVARVGSLDADEATALVDGAPWKYGGGSYYRGLRYLTAESGATGQSPLWLLRR